MAKRFTFWLTLVAVGVCLFNYMGYDHDHIVLYQASIPAWIIPLFTDILNVSKLTLYLLTIGSWFVIGLLLDRLVASQRGKVSR